LLLVNLRQLEKEEAILRGEIPAGELDIAGLDECVEVPFPLQYELEAELVEKAVLVRGKLSLELQCTCVRCLKVFTLRLDLRDWAAHLALEGEEAVTVVNDRVDLTPFLREDMLLEFPQHPLCEPGCKGLPDLRKGSFNRADQGSQEPIDSSPWAELNKLKLKNF